MPRLSKLLAENAGKGTPLRAQVVGNATEILLYDVIDPLCGASAKSLGAALAAAEGPVTLRINSPGGDVFEGRAMASLLRSHPAPVTAVVDGLAASAATTVALAATRVSMVKGSFLMIHRSWSLALGNAEDLLATASLLEKIDAEIARDYATKSGQSLDQALAWMKAETWFTADEAVAAHLADALFDGKTVKGAFNLTAYDNVPRALLDDPANDEPTPDQVWAANDRRLRLIG